MRRAAEDLCIRVSGVGNHALLAQSQSSVVCLLFISTTFASSKLVVNAIWAPPVATLHFNIIVDFKVAMLDSPRLQALLADATVVVMAVAMAVMSGESLVHQNLTSLFHSPAGRSKVLYDT